MKELLNIEQLIRESSFHWIQHFIRRYIGYHPRIHFLKAPETSQLSPDSFDVVIAFNFMSSYVDRQQVVAEVTRVLQPGGLFFYTSINKNILTWLYYAQILKRFNQESLLQSFVYSLFSDPDHLREFIEDYGFEVLAQVGIRPDFSSGPFYSPGAYKLTKSFKFGYLACARKLKEH